MKNPTLFKHVLVVLLLLFSLQSIAQNYKPFSIREKVDIKGSMLVIGNNILGKDNFDFNDDTKDNQDISMQYIDIDTDPSTFSSSSANLLVPAQRDGSATTCYRVAYAALYWGAVLQSGSRTDINKVKLKLPGSSTYNDIVGEVIYDAIVSPIVSITNEPGNTPYACYADVTSLLSGLVNLQGDYTVANVQSSLGFNAGTGLSAGWTLYVIYEDPLLTTKSFISFDGFSHISSSHTQSIPVSGFNTPQSGQVDFQVAYAALDGDKTKRATKLELNGKEITTPLRGANKFFGSVIENGNGITHPRNPFGSNTLGYDTGFLNVYSGNPSYINNNATSANLTIQVAKGQADPIFFFFSAFSVDIIAPEITMTKLVLDTAGNNIDGADVTLGQNLFYKISYQSTGNDNVTQFTLKDVLPDNVIFNPATDLDLSNSGGATLQSYNPTTRTLIFNIPNSSVEVNDPIFEIRIAVKIVSECYALSQACSNEITNQAYATYRGVRNTTLIQDEGSFNSVACLGTPAPTNFLVNINNCTFEKNEVLCGSSVVLTAASGYDSYSWSRNPSGTPVIGTGQTYTALETGAYYVKNTTASTCISIEEKINVIPYGNTITNPVIPFADLLPMCPNDGKVLPTILLCGANATKLISTGISDASSIIWQKLDETSCPALGVNNCANENSACTWNQVGTGPNYLSNTSGQFRVVINYTGGCFSIFYFNVYQNLLNPTATVNDIICNTPGQITVGGVPGGYEYSIDGTNWQSSNIFTINIPNYYVIYIRQVGVNTNPCIFQTPSTYVRQRNFTVSTFITQPYCNGGQGSVKLAANDALPQYYYSISQGATLINSVGPIADSDYTFANLNPGTYTYTVSTDDGCTFTDNIVITNPALLTATVALTKPLTCTDGVLTVYPIGGTAPFEYFVNSTTVSQDSPIISAPTPGVYNITVVDFNNCTTTTSITVDATPPPVFNITHTDILCSGSGNTGSININVSNANGNSLLYSIDNGATFVSSPTFTGLANGNYEVVVQYTTGPDACTSTPQTVNIATLPAVTATSTLTTPYTCLTTGTITVSGVSGGTAPYTYSINGVTFQPGLTFSGLTNGSYIVTVRDANGCTFNTNAINIAPLTPPTDLTFNSTALTCPTNTSTVTITGTTGGFGALEYQIIAPSGLATAYQSSNTFSGLAPNTYTFQVKDANDCVYNESYTITPLPALTVVGQLINDVTCVGSSNGSVRYTVSGSSGFTYTINGGASVAGTSPINLSGLAAGSYAILITDTATNCQATTSVTVNQPAIALSATTTVSPITCVTNGSVVINATGGWGGYSYSLTQPNASVLPAQPSNTFNNLTQTGTYIATVTDANNCIVSSSFVINVPGAPTATISPSSNFCYDGVTGASLIVNASGGQTPYEYNINGGPFQASNTFNNLVPGNYTIIVRDAYGCTFTLPVQTIAQQLTVNTVLTKELDCSASPNAVITGTIAGGYAPFTYAVSINGGAYTSLGATGTPYTYSTATAATYQFRIADSRNCVALSNVITINPITNPTVSATTTNVSCNGASNGSAQLVGSGGSGGYTFSNDNVTFTATSLFTGLSNGSHTFYVRDSKSCTSSVTINITQPTPLVATASATPFSCSVTNTNVAAVITIAAPTTGTAPYQYSFNNGTTFSSSNTLTVNDNGVDQTFAYVVRDANGCLTAAQNITLTALDPPTDLAFSSAAVTCTATTTTVTVTATNGVGPLQYETIAPSPVIIAKQGSNAIAGLTPGTYVFQVTDANGCYYSESYTIAPVTPIAIAGNLVSDVLCFGGNNGSGTYSVSGNATVGNYTFILTAGTLGTGTLTQSGNVITLSNVAVGTYTVQVTDSATGCVANASIAVSEPANPLTLAETSNINANCFNRAQVTVSGSGGTPNYTYAFVQDGASPAGLYTSSNTATLDPITTTNWDVWVMDNQGCTFKLDVVIATDAVPTINPVALQCYTGTPISITLSGTAVGTPTYSIGGSYQASPTFSINAPGIYNVSIRDGNGCIASRTFELRPELLLDANMTQDLTCAVDASISLTASGGTGTYSTYEVSYNGGAYAASGSTYTATVDGNYQFRVTDSQGCQALSNIIIVTPNTTPTQTFTQTNVSCNGNSDGSIVVTAADGIAPYQYSIDNGATFQASNVFNGLAAGTYNIVVRDSKSCISVATAVTITQPTPLAATASATAFSCSVTNTNVAAVITIAVPTTGTAPYQYSFNNGTTFSSSNTLTVNDNGVDQTFSYVVRDANGCLTAAQNIMLVALDPPTDLDFASAAVTCTATTTTVTLTATNGVGPLQYQIITPAASATAYQASNVFSGLAPGTYTFRVMDANGCYYSESYTIAPVTPIAVTGLKLSDVLCNAGNSGAIQFTVSGYAGTYTSVLTSGAGTISQVGNTINLTGLVADTYTLEVTDDITGCTATHTMTITEPTALTFGATATNVFCSNDESQITVTAVGGTVNYTYAAVITGNPAPIAAAYGSSNVIPVITNSAADLVWDIYVKDANGCVEMNTVTIISDALPTVTTPPLASNQCTVSTGFTFTATGTGLAPLTYSINGVTFQSSPTFTVNAPGSYFVTIMDRNGCTAISPTPTIVYAPIEANAILTKDLTCSVPTDATISISVSGGNAPYSYEVSFNGGAYAGIAGSPYVTNSAGTYQFRITDANTCTRESNVITVAAIVPVTASNTSVNPTCNGDSDGSIRLTALSGEAPFTYSIDNGVTFVSSNVFGGLSAGTYNYVVRDTKGCEAIGSIALNDPAPISPNIVVNGIQCSPNTPGSFDINIASGGTAPYVYTLYDNSFTQINTYTEIASASTPVWNFGGLNFGDYYITIVDANGCEFRSNRLRIEPIPYLNLTSTFASASCLTGVDVTLNVSGGIPDYTYSIYGQPATAVTTSATSYTFTGLDQGTTYVFEVIDVNGCPSYLEILTDIISPIIIDPLVATNVTCFGANNGEITFTVDQYDLSTTDLYYEVRDNLTNTAVIPAINGHLTGFNPGPANGTITGLPAGNYTLFVREFDGTTLCSTTLQFQIRQPVQPLASTISSVINANCNSGAQITLTTTGGTGPYNYAAGAPGFVPVALDFGPSNVLNLDDAIRLNWDIVIEDANGCQFRINTTIIRDADPTINPVAQQCFTGTPISITLTGTTSVGPVTYSIGTGGIAGAYQVSPTFSINAAGTYDVFIKDGNGCVATTTYIVEPALLLDADLTKDLDCTASPNAEITLTPSGGTGTYSTYEVNYNAGGYVVIAGSPYTAVADGSYQFRVTDSQGCQSVSNIITIDPVVNPTHTFTQTNVSCNGGSDGSIVVTATGGVAPYEYSIDNGATYQVSNVFTGLNAAGVYNVVVRDSKSCVSPGTLVPITEPALVGGTIALTQGLTCGAGNATQAAIVTVTGSGGTAPYTYSFDGGVNYTTTNTYSTYTAGLVTAYIKDANGCLIPVALTENVPALDPPTDLAFSATAVTCIALTSDVQLTTTNGTLPLSYAILSPAAATGNVTGAASGLFTGLAPDTYMFEVTDANGCTYQESYTVVPVTNITVSGALINDVSCNGGSNGAVDFTVSNFAGTYSYTVNGGPAVVGQSAVTINLTGLPIGNQQIVVTDEITGCTDTFTVLVSEPASPLTFTATTTNVFCTNDESQITVTASGGTVSYSYAAVVTGAPAPLAAAYGTNNVVTVDTNSGADLVWDVYVRDANGCTTMNTETVILDPLPSVSTPPLAINQCTVTSGFTFTAFGETGVGPFTYSINGGASYQASPTFTVNAPGTYTVTIRDANGCTANSATTTVVYAPLNSVITLTKELDCTGTPDAEITGTIIGGLAPYTYEVDINGSGYGALGAVVSPYTYTTGIAGTYQFRITDANGCQAVTNIITIDPLTNPSFTESHTNVSCNGGSDGSIVVTATGGVAPYEYSIDNGATYQASNVFTGLNAAGVYNVVVRDSKSCVSPGTLVPITEPAVVGGTIALTQGLTCGAGNATQAAIVTVTGSGGTAPYTYSFDGGVNYTTTNTYSTYTAGVVTAYIKDANGCIIPVALTENLPALVPPTDLDFSSPPVTCIATTTDVTLTVTDGIGVLSYEIISPIAVGPQASNVFTSLAPDTYMFEVTDANGCAYQESYTVLPVTNITIAGLKLNDVYCFGDNTGAIEFTVSDYAGTYTAVLLTGAGTMVPSGNTIDLTGLIADTYTVEVTDDITGCTATETITITEPASVLAFTATTTNIYCTNDESQITVTASGGTVSYSYAAVVTGAPAPAVYGTSNVVTVDTNSGADLVWDVYVRDANGCTEMNTVTVILDPLPSVTVPAMASNQCNLTGDPYAFTITGSSGIAPLTYSVGSGFQSSGTFTGLTPGNYFVTVKDGNGCEAISPTFVTIYAPLDFTPTITALPTCANNDGVITVSQSGGSGTYTYAISPSVGSLSGNVFSGVPSGTYTITITDTVTSCTKDVSITLTAATPVTFTTSVDDVSCNGGNDGVITVNLPVSNDNPIYTYEIIAGPTTVPAQNSNIFSGLIQGNYTVQVNSGRGCSTTAVISVGEPTPLTVSGTATPFGCAPDNSVNTSTVTITEAGGTASYTYSIDGVNYLTSNIFDIIDTGVSQTINIFTKDANGCIATNTVVIAPLPTLTAASVAIATPIDCNNTGSVSITVTGGSGNFSYQMLPGGAAQASDTFSITLPGTYYFQVNDLTTGCTIATSAFTVVPFDTIDVVATATVPVICFGDNNGALEINVSGYSGTYNYEVFDNSGASVGGVVSANTSTNPLVITGLIGGNYTVTVTETASPFCATVSNTVTIASPASALTLLAFETSNVTCTNDKGTITATATGGWGTYEFELTGAATVAYSSNGTFTNLSAGNYIVNARDAGGCIVSQNVTLAIPAPINATVTPSTNLLTCFGDTNASITVGGVTGGQGSNYTYTLNMVLPTASASGPQALPVFSGLGAGTYNVVITDGYNCSFTSANIVIATPTEIQSQLVKTTSQTCTTGTTLTLSASGGTGPYTYSDDANFTAGPLGSFVSSTTINVAPGTYVYYVRDANGCVANATNEIKIDPLPTLVVNLDVANAFINCAGDNTGVIVATAQGGLGSYVYTLQDALGNTIPAVQLSPGRFTQLFAGDYRVRVDSGDCNTTSALVSITEPASPLIVPFTTTNVTCNGANNGTLVVNASGGTGQIKYAISPQLNQFFESNTFNNLAAGTYDVIAQDELGCFVLINFTISEPSPLALNIVPGSLIPEVCTGDMDGEFSIDMSGGTAPYSVSLDDYNGIYTTGTLVQTQFDFIGLSGGDHMVYVRDALGCESEWTIAFPESVILDPVAVVEYGCTDNISSNTVSVTVDASITNPSDIDYSLDGGAYQASNIFSNVAAGLNHYIDVRHTNGCIKRSNTFDITAYAPLTLVLNDGGLNEIVTVTAGGSGSYEYTLNGENYGSSNSFIIYKSGDYTVTVTDRNGCIASATRYFDYIDVCIPNYFTPNGDGIEDGWGPGCTINYKDLTVDVMDRYGRKVDVLRVGEKWDGKYRGKELPTGDYWYVLKLNDKKDKRSFIGHFTLYR